MCPVMCMISLSLTQPKSICKRVDYAHCFLQHVACSTIELVPKMADTGIPHQPREGDNANVCAFSASLFLQLALKLMKEHGSTPALVTKLRELTVDESAYHKFRKQAAKDINLLKIEYGRKQQELRIEKRMAAKRPAPTNEAGAAD